ncbi:MAG: DUF2911 domain-containing protein [Robiginitalea sp.]
MKALKWIVGILTALFLLGYFVGLPYLREQTKKYSPERTTTYRQNGFDLRTTYCSPAKKGRDIFGGLVPYGEVWRTGANGPTTFHTGTDLMVEGQALPAGDYSLWTIPGPDQWTVIFNKKIPDWGVTLSSLGRKTTRDPKADALQVTAPVLEGASGEPGFHENFLIDFITREEELFLRLAWDTTQVVVRLNS